MEHCNWKNNGKIKLMIIVGTRPEIIRLAAVIKKCRKYFDTILVHTGQNYDYNLNGVQSATPFQGVNIMVNEYNDGSKTTSKVIR